MLDNHLGGSSLGKTNYPCFGSHQLPVAPHLEVGPHEIFPNNTGIQNSVVIVQVCLRMHIVEISWTQFPYHIYKTQSCISINTILVLWLLYSFCPSFCDGPWTFRCRSYRSCIVNVSVGYRHPMVSCSLHFDQSWFFCDGFHLLEREVFDEEESYTHLCV